MDRLYKKLISYLGYKYYLPLIQENHKLLTGGQVSVFLDKYKGVFWIDVRSHLFQRILTTGSYEYDNVILIEKLLNDKTGDVIDVGANVGFFSILLAKSIPVGNKVLSIEPNPQAIELLVKNIELNDCSDKIILYKGIASSKSANVELNYIDGLPEYSSPSSIKHVSVSSYKTIKQEVEANTIDELVKLYDLSPKFIKIDVEGSELEVIKGCAETLKKHKPHLLIEIVDYFNSNKDESVVHFLKESGYIIFNKNLKVEKSIFLGDYICIHNSNKFNI